MRRTPVRMLLALSIAAPLFAQDLAGRLESHAAALPPASASHLGRLTPALLNRLSPGATDSVIVMLREAAGSSGAGGRDRQASLLDELTRLHAKGVHAYRIIDAVAATVSPAEAVRLAADPAVVEVVPDRAIPLSPRGLTAPSSGATAHAAAHTAAALPPLVPPASLQPKELHPACTQGSTPSLEPEALQLTHTAFSNPTVPQAQRLRTPQGRRIDGSGVKVAYMAEGIDINNPDFIRANGSHVFVAYKDFTGDGPNAPTTAGEAFIDAGSIAAQGRKVYDVNNYLRNKLSAPCPIRILGMAPGASLVGLRVFGKANMTTNAGFLAAIDYAVNVAHVDVLNESFGGNPFPDLASDPLVQADAAAIAAGVTVTVSTGDAGVNNTIGSPASSSGIISVGASTQFREYLQAGNSGAQLGSGYVSNNISSLSSGGFTQHGPRTVDVLAPGDLSWAPCTANTVKYSDCMDLNQKPSDLFESGGTSESAPLTAGEAALVIQAYRSTHGGANPSPALIKQIIMSSATDLGIPAQQQGAGLIDSYRAVQMALSYRDAQGSPAPHDRALLINDTTAFGATAARNTPERFSFTVTNEGSAPQIVAPRVRTLGRTLFRESFTRYLDPFSDPNVFVDANGNGRAYLEQPFRVPAGVQSLDLSLAYGVSLQSSALVRFSVFDPRNRLIGYSEPQSSGGGSGFGQVSIRNPLPGVYRAIVFTRHPLFAVGTTPPTQATYHGPVELTVAALRFTPSGSVFPAGRLIQPGASATFTVRVRTPATPGDRGMEVVFPSPSGTTTLLGALPISLRSLVPLGPRGGSWTGTLTGGNGRQGAGNVQTFAFDVPPGLRDMELALAVADPNSNLEGVLVDPSGQPAEVQTTVAALDASFNPSFYTRAMQFFRRNPAPGRYQFLLLINNTVAGTATSQRFQASIRFNGVQVRARGVPDNPATVLRAGKAAYATISLNNNGLVTKDYFVDARLAMQGPVALQAPFSYSTTLPITASQNLPPFLVPPAVNRVDVVATSPSQISLDVTAEAGAPPFGFTGSPSLSQTASPFFDPTTGLYMAVASLSGSELASAFLLTAPAELGPFGSSAGPSTVEVRTTAYGQPFDRAVTAATGDLWSPFSDVNNALELPPQSSGSIRVRFVPQGQPGAVVRGYLYLDTYNFNSSSGDEVAAIPYAYTIG